MDTTMMAPGMFAAISAAAAAAAWGGGYFLEVDGIDDPPASKGPNDAVVWVIREEHCDCVGVRSRSVVVCRCACVNHRGCVVRFWSCVNPVGGESTAVLQFPELGAVTAWSHSRAILVAMPTAAARGRMGCCRLV